MRSLDNPAIRTADRTMQYFLSTWPAAMAEDQQERQSAPWSAEAAEGLTSEPQSDRDQAQELRQQVQDLTRALEAISLTNPQLLERDVLPGWSSTGGTAPDGPQVPQQATGGMMQSLRGIPDRTRSTGHLRTLLRLENGISRSLPVFQGSLHTT